jgi:hypothetical protein
MRRLAALLLALALAGCSSPCQELGDRLCRCVGVGTTRDNCERQVKERLKDLDPSSDVQDLCDAKLGTCGAPEGADFCDWTLTACGKASCGLSVEDPAAVCGE